MSASEDVTNPDVAEWLALGGHLDTPEGRVFVVDLDVPDATDEPVVVLHGFPTSSMDWRGVLDALGRGRRRVVLFDFVGFGLSDKPDRRYGIDLHADTTVAVLGALGIDRCVLVTHDMGDTVGGELLARTMPSGTVPDDPAWSAPADAPVLTSGTGRPPDPLNLEVTRRVIVNGSIYLDLASLTEGQHRLWSAPDERLPDELGELVGGEGLGQGIAKVFHPDHQPDDAERAALVASIEYQRGHLLMPRLIRYLDDRRRAEARYTGAIETHPSPLYILWADEDPVAVAAMGEQLAARRPDADYRPLAGFGHYPMLEDPTRFGAELAQALR
ncbi:MAG TPA: alpha/beta hydrolase [Acidimicrobiales bacterium]|nr:alpha/beta hydrolase [Acidimicrobiales bacterium]